MGRELRALLGHFGITRISVFAKIEGSEEAVREWLAEDLGLKKTDGMETKIKIARVLDAWEAARDRVAKQSSLESEARAGGGGEEQLDTMRAEVATPCLPGRFCSKACGVPQRFRVRLNVQSIAPENPCHDTQSTLRRTSSQ